MAAEETDIDKEVMKNNAVIDNPVVSSESHSLKTGSAENIFSTPPPSKYGAEYFYTPQTEVGISSDIARNETVLTTTITPIARPISPQRTANPSDLSTIDYIETTPSGSNATTSFPPSSFTTPTGPPKSLKPTPVSTQALLTNPGDDGKSDLDFVNEQLNMLNQESGELATPIHKSDKQVSQDLAKKIKESIIKRKEKFKSPIKKFMSRLSFHGRGIKRSPSKIHPIKPKRLKRLSGVMEKDTKKQDDNSSDGDIADDDASDNDSSDDNWEIIEDSETEIDKELEKNATKCNLSAINVKNILHQVITNEAVIAMVKNTLMEADVNDESSKGLVYEPKMTRSKMKEVLEKEGENRRPWPLTPIKQPKSKGKSFLELELTDEDEEDEEYNPDKDKEMGSLSDEDSESVASSQSHFGSPCPRTPVTPRMSDLDRTPSVRGDDDSLLSPMGPPLSKGILSAQKQSLGQKFQDAMAEHDRKQEEETIALRTRSKYSLTDTSLTELEQIFVAPDITADLYDTKCNDNDWQIFLQSLVIPPEPEDTNDGCDDETNDPEYDYLEDVKETEPDKEEIRCDRAVRVSKQEMNELMDELFEAYEDVEMMEDSEKEIMKMKARNNLLTSNIKKKSHETTNLVSSMKVSEIERRQIDDQMRKHVQLLAQTYILGMDDPQNNKELIQNSKFLINELDMFSKSSTFGITPSSAYRACNLDKAVRLVNDDIESSSTETEITKTRKRGISPDRSLGFLISKYYLTLSKEQKDEIYEVIGVKDGKAVSDPSVLLQKSCLQSLSEHQKELIWNSSIFIYPDLLPHGKLEVVRKRNKNTRVFFTEAEDNLLAIGMDQFKKLPYFRKLIQKFLIPCKTDEQIKIRIKNLGANKAPDNAVKFYKKNKKLPPFIRYTDPFSFSQIKPPREQSQSNQPTWCKEIKIKEIMLSNEVEDDTNQIKRSSSVNIPVPSESATDKDEEKSRSAPVTPSQRTDSQTLVNKPPPQAAVRVISHQVDDMDSGLSNMSWPSPTREHKLIKDTRKDSFRLCKSPGFIPLHPGMSDSETGIKSPINVKFLDRDIIGSPRSRSPLTVKLLDRDSITSPRSRSPLPVKLLDRDSIASPRSMSPLTVREMDVESVTRSGQLVSETDNRDNMECGESLSQIPSSPMVLTSTNSIVVTLAGGISNSLTMPSSPFSNLVTSVNLTSTTSAPSQNISNMVTTAPVCSNTGVVTNISHDSYPSVVTQSGSLSSANRHDMTPSNSFVTQPDNVTSVNGSDLTPSNSLVTLPDNVTLLNRCDMTPSNSLVTQLDDVTLGDKCDVTPTNSLVFQSDKMTSVTQHNVATPGAVTTSSSPVGFLSQFHSFSDTAINETFPTTVSSVSNTSVSDTSVSVPIGSGTSTLISNVSNTSTSISSVFNTSTCTSISSVSMATVSDAVNTSHSSLLSPFSSLPQQTVVSSIQNTTLPTTTSTADICGITKSASLSSKMDIDTITHTLVKDNSSVAVPSSTVDNPVSFLSFPTTSGNLENSFSSIVSKNTSSTSESQSRSSEERVLTFTTSADLLFEHSLPFDSYRSMQNENSIVCSTSSDVVMTTTLTTSSVNTFVTSASFSDTNVTNSLNVFSATGTFNEGWKTPEKRNPSPFNQSTPESTSSFSSFMTSSLDATPTKYQRALETTPTKSTPSPHYRAIAPKSQNTPPSQQEVQIDLPKKPRRTRSRRSSPRKLSLQQQARAICPKGFVIKTYVSPSKAAASSIKNRVLRRSLKILPTPLDMPKKKLHITVKPSKGDNSKNTDDMEDDGVLSKNDTASEYDTMESECMSDDNENTNDLSKKSAEGMLTRSARKNQLRKSRRKRNSDSCKSVESDDTQSETEEMSQDDSQNEEEANDDEDHLAALMAASTTIGFASKKIFDSKEIKDNRSKAKKRKDATLAMLAPNLLRADPHKDDRDTAFAQSYLTKARELLKGDLDLYEKLLKILYDFGKSEQSPVQLYKDVENLLVNYPELVDDFSGFLKPEQAVECGCFMTNQQFDRAKTLLRKLQIYFDRHPSHFQKVMKLISKWSQKSSKNNKEIRNKLETMLKGQTHLIEELSLFFDDDPPPESYLSDFEEIVLGDSDEDSMKEFDGYEFLELPEEDDVSGTKRCQCSCHETSLNQNVRKRNKHCYKCCLKVIDGELYYRVSSKVMKKVKVVYHKPIKARTIEHNKSPPRPPPVPQAPPDQTWEEDDTGAEKENVDITQIEETGRSRSMNIKLKISNKKKSSSKGRFWTLSEIAESPRKSAETSMSASTSRNHHRSGTQLPNFESTNQNVLNSATTSLVGRQSPTASQLLSPSLTDQSKVVPVTPVDEMFDIQQLGQSSEFIDDVPPLYDDPVGLTLPESDKNAASTVSKSKSVNEQQTSLDFHSLFSNGDTNKESSETFQSDSVLTDRTLSPLSGVGGSSNTINVDLVLERAGFSPHKLTNPAVNLLQVGNVPPHHDSSSDILAKALKVADIGRGDVTMDTNTSLFGLNIKTSNESSSVPTDFSVISSMKETHHEPVNSNTQSDIQKCNNISVLGSLNSGENINNSSQTDDPDSRELRTDTTCTKTEILNTAQPSDKSVMGNGDYNTENEMQEETHDISELATHNFNVENNMATEQTPCTTTTEEDSKGDNLCDNRESEWSRESDRIILEAVKEHGPGSLTFEYISRSLLNKTARQISERFHQLLELLTEEETPSEEETEEDKI